MWKDLARRTLARLGHPSRPAPENIGAQVVAVEAVGGEKGLDGQDARRGNSPPPPADGRAADPAAGGDNASADGRDE